MERGSRKRSSGVGSEKMERVGGRKEKMEGHCWTGQSPQWAVVSVEEEEGEDPEKDGKGSRKRSSSAGSEKMERVGGR